MHYKTKLCYFVSYSVFCRPAFHLNSFIEKKTTLKTTLTKRLRLKVAPSKKAAAYDAVPNCFVPWHEFRSLTSLHTRTNICGCKRQMCATTQKWAQVYATQITASSGKGHHDDNNCASYHSNGLGMCAKPENESTMSKGDSGNAVARFCSFWCVCCDLLISPDLCARTCRLRFHKQSGHYAHYVCLKRQQNTLRWHGEGH